MEKNQEKQWFYNIYDNEKLLCKHYHYLSGNSSEVVVMNEWKNFMDADNSIRSSADRRKKGWPNKKTREKFQKRFGEVRLEEQKRDYILIERSNSLW